tara:strand:- start:167 stop:349 length:183 start_codon:yes stop_codon:yes gene_type:complete
MLVTAILDPVSCNTISSSKLGVDESKLFANEEDTRSADGPFACFEGTITEIISSLVSSTT